MNDQHFLPTESSKVGSGSVCMCVRAHVCSKEILSINAQKNTRYF